MKEREYADGFTQRNDQTSFRRVSDSSSAATISLVVAETTQSLQDRYIGPTAATKR